MFANKLVAVLNKSIDTGVIMNALAHMSLGLGANLDDDKKLFDDYIDADGNLYPNIQRIPFIVLRASGGKIRTLVEKAREQNIQHSVFLNTMTKDTYVEQLARTKETKEEDLIYYGAALCGPWDLVSELTKKFSLWK